MRIDGDNYQSRIPETINRAVAPSRVETRPTVSRYSGNGFGQNNLGANTLKLNLNRQVDARLATAAVQSGPRQSPYEALNSIRNIQLPSLNDAAAIQTYQRQRADIADAALQSAVPPTRADFSALHGRIADLEYQDALSYYNSNTRELESISVSAHADLNGSPTAVLDEAANRVWDAGQNDPKEGGTVLAEEIDALNARFGPDAGGQLVAKLYQDAQDGEYEHDLYNILAFTGGDEAGGMDRAGLPVGARNSIGTAIGQAYDQMSVADRTDFVKTLVSVSEFGGFRPGSTDTARIADLIARSENPELRADMVDALTDRMVEIQPGLLGNNGGADIRALANSAAVIAGGGATSAEQSALFDNIITRFPDMHPKQLKSLMDDPTLKDNLSTVFIDNSEAIIKSMTNEAGGLLNTHASDGLRQFFEMTMFSKNPGQLREDVMGEAVNVISQFADPTASPTRGRTKVDDARTAGSLIGLVQAAALKQHDSIEDDQKSREATTKMFTGMAFAFVPGASDVLGEGSGKLLEFAYGKAVDYAKTHSESSLGGVINNLSDGDSLKNIDEGFKAIRDLSFQVEHNLEAENDSDLYSAFVEGYSRTGVDQLFADALGQ